MDEFKHRGPSPEVGRWVPPLPSELIPEHELTIAARVRSWDLSITNLSFLAEHDALPLCSLVAASVGLHPFFADEGWCFGVALPYFRGESQPDSLIDDPSLHATANGRQGFSMLDAFIRRMSVAHSAVQAGTLVTTGSDEADPIVTPAEFLRYCRQRTPPWSVASAEAWSAPAVPPATHMTPESVPQLGQLQQENPEQRQARLLDWYEEEERKNGERGALQRTADREGMDRSNCSKLIKKARGKRDEARRTGAMWGQLGK